ncbi:MAG: hypothetical protein ACREEW_14430 [Caulobacteraceae bacterium]
MVQIHLSIRDVIRAARNAYENHELQAQTFNRPIKDGPSCQYSGPCAIGAALTPEQRLQLDSLSGNKAIQYLIRMGVITSDSPVALIELQSNHDFWMLHPDMEGTFVNMLNQLEEKYA